MDETGDIKEPNKEITGETASSEAKGAGDTRESQPMGLNDFRKYKTKETVDFKKSGLKAPGEPVAETAGKITDSKIKEAGDKKETTPELKADAVKPAVKDTAVKEPQPLTPPNPPNVKPTMVPLFSKRSVIFLILGFMVGVGLGLAYWAFSPSSLVTEEPDTNQGSGGFLQSMGIGPPPPTEPWMTQTNIQVVNPGSTFMTIGQLANVGIYYAAKAESLPFLQFLSLDLEHYSPLYHHTVDELDGIISTKYNSNSEQPTIVLQVTTPTAEEANFLINRIPTVFENFLVAEENGQRQETRENILVTIEDVKKAIIQSEQEVNLLETAGVSSIDKDPNYVAVSTRVTALEIELTRQANVIAGQIYQGNSGASDNATKQYLDTLRQLGSVKADILVAENISSTLAGQISNIDFRNDPVYLRLTAEVASLETRVNTIMNGGAGSGAKITVGLAEMIANGDVTSVEYEEARAKFETASAALSESKKKLATMQNQMYQEQRELALDYQIAQSVVNILNTKFTILVQKLGTLATDNVSLTPQQSFELTSAALAKARQDMVAIQAKLVSNQLPRDLDYQVAKAKVDTLNRQLTTLNNSLSATYVNTGGAAQAINTLAFGIPSQAEIVFPIRIKARNALAIGAILGVLIAWGSLNRKWLIKMFSNPGERTEAY